MGHRNDKSGDWDGQGNYFVGWEIWINGEVMVNDYNNNVNDL